MKSLKLQTAPVNVEYLASCNISRRHWQHTCHCDNAVSYAAIPKEPVFKIAQVPVSPVTVTLLARETVPSQIGELVQQPVKLEQPLL